MTVNKPRNMPGPGSVPNLSPRGDDVHNYFPVLSHFWYNPKLYTAPSAQPQPQGGEAVITEPRHMMMMSVGKNWGVIMILLSSLPAVLSSEQVKTDNCNYEYSHVPSRLTIKEMIVSYDLR